ncbi:hypothetical protein HGM15179_020905 [Zosterops borbonicus]|uniref:Uncharacterized protein n=1 Tax=Zosterops borbonicus TaxID=364589 RepID=A0A8K1FWP5_9PASS|nr:hypothetical protein HGM15179_020905 [Zosterops borbonicus]
MCIISTLHPLILCKEPSVGPYTHQLDPKNFRLNPTLMNWTLYPLFGPQGPTARPYTHHWDPKSLQLDPTSTSVSPKAFSWSLHPAVGPQDPSAGPYMHQWDTKHPSWTLHPIIHPYTHQTNLKPLIWSSGPSSHPFTLELPPALSVTAGPQEQLPTPLAVTWTPSVPSQTLEISGFSRLSQSQSCSAFGVWEGMNFPALSTWGEQDTTRTLPVLWILASEEVWAERWRFQCCPWTHLSCRAPNTDFPVSSVSLLLVNSSLLALSPCCLCQLT